MVIPADGLLILSGQVTDTVLHPIIIIVIKMLYGNCFWNALCVQNIEVYIEPLFHH